LYTRCGREQKLAISQRMGADALAAMMVDCNLKQWQLKKVVKYITYAGLSSYEQRTTIGRFICFFD
jgi:hypothetical protein